MGRCYRSEMTGMSELCVSVVHAFVDDDVDDDDHVALGICFLHGVQDGQLYSLV